MNKKGAQSKRETSPKRFRFIERPEFYLVYLLFYIAVWFFKAPTGKDIIAIIIAILIFLPIYYAAFTKASLKFIPHMIAMEIIGFALIPFHGANGVFHVYACCQAAYQRPLRVALIMFGVLALLYGGVSFIAKVNLIEIGLNIFIGFIIGVGVLASAEQLEYQKLKEQAFELDRKMVANDERERIARDLHDVLGHTLTMVALKSQIVEKLLDSDPEKAKEELKNIHETARHALKDVRDTVADMSITSLEKELEHARTALKTAMIGLTVHGEVPALTEHQSKMLGLCLRELVTNIIRHADAKSAEIFFIQEEKNINIVVKDNGGVQNYQEGTGFAGVRYRVSDIGGQVEVVVKDGLVVKVSVPVAKEGSKINLKQKPMGSEALV